MDLTLAQWDLRLRRCVRGFVSLAVSMSLAASGASCSQGRVPDTRDYLGPAVDRLPESAVYAALVGPPAFEFGRDTRDDNSWLVFMDRGFQPMGYVHRKGMFRAQIARYGAGVAFPDRESITTVSASGVTTTPVETKGMVSDTTSARNHDQNAIIWLDIGIQTGSAGYQTAPVQIGPAGRVQAMPVLGGRLASPGQCGGRHLAILELSDRRYQAIELDNGVVRRGPEWSGVDFQDGGQVPWTCMGGIARFYLSNNIYALPNIGTEVREIDLSTLATRSLGFRNVGTSEEAFDAATACWQSIPASGDAWWRDGSTRAFVTSEGDVMRVRDDGTDVQKLYSLKDTIRGRFLIDGADASSDKTHLMWTEGMTGDGLLDRNGGHFVTIDPRSRRIEPAVTPAPDWLRRLLNEEPGLVQDVAVIGP